MQDIHLPSLFQIQIYFLSSMYRNEDKYSYFASKLLNKILNTNQKLFVAGKLSNTARLFVEASFISHSQHELNGEEFWLKYSTLKFKNVIDAGANRGDWTSLLLSTRKEVERIVLIEPNEDRAQDLKKRLAN